MIAVLIGTTASGKTEIALDIAKNTGAHILSCDSLLVYKDLKIGTAKPTVSEMATTPHYGIDLVGAEKNFNAGDYVRYATSVIHDCRKKNTPLLIVGGTGFYLKALLHGIWDAPPTNPELRSQLEASVAHLPEESRSSALYKKLEDLDPEYAPKIKPQDHYRIIRALEIIKSSNRKMSEMLKDPKLQNPLPYSYKIFGITRTPRDLERRIVERTNLMFSQGLVKETEELIQRYLRKPDFEESDLETVPRALHSVGYNEVLQFFLGKMTLMECRERVVISTRQLAKKQRTFFRGMGIDVQWMNLPAQSEELKSQLMSTLNEHT